MIFRRLLAATECPQIEIVPDHKLPQINEREKEMFDSLITKELDPNGGAHIIIAYQDEINTRLDESLHQKFALYFLSMVYSESVNEDAAETSSLKENDEMSAMKSSSPTTREYAANYALGIVRNSAARIPELISYFANNYPNLTVKSSLLLNSKEINTLKISEYHKHVNATYLNGTYRYGPLLQTSIVGVKNEEIGDYFPEFINEYLETSPFLSPVMPWGCLSINENMKPQNSNDGPIIWARYHLSHISTHLNPFV